MFYIQRGDDDPERRVQDDDDDEEVLDFVFDGSVRYAASYASEGRSHITALRELVEAALGGRGDAQALGQSIQTLVTRVDKAITHFSNVPKNKPWLGEYCAANVEAYQRARQWLLHMNHWLSDPRKEYLTEGMLGLERAVSDVDTLVAQAREQGQQD